MKRAAVLCCLLACLASGASALGFFENLFSKENLFSFPASRRGRSSPPSAPKESAGATITLGSDADPNDDMIARLMKAVQDVIPIESELNSQEPEVIEIEANGRPFEPRRVDEMQDFGSQLAAKSAEDEDDDGLLFGDQLIGRDTFSRQNDAGSDEIESTDITGPGAEAAAAGDNEIRCVPKVMQIEETVYDREIKCHHSFQEKCHMTYITDYRSSTQEKCETTFKKNCHITFKAMPFNETVNICHTPIVRKCGDKSVGPDVCSTHYETNCETRYKTYEVEQDEPVCKMELMKKCEDVKIPIGSRRSRSGRQFDLGSAEEGAATDSGADETNAVDTTSGDENAVSVDQVCEEWPVQKCELVKRNVKKVHPETECRKIPRQVCIPNNCEMVQGEEVCRDEDKVQIQNVPQEECELQPEENCHAEAVLVPRLVPKPNCVKVPKEICVNTKSNPRRVKKPVVKQWCYNPKDLNDLRASNIVPNEVTSDDGSLPGETGRAAQNIFARISKLLFNKRR